MWRRNLLKALQSVVHLQSFSQGNRATVSHRVAGESERQEER